jgi:hypothetical protein
MVPIPIRILAGSELVVPLLFALFVSDYRKAFGLSLFWTVIASLLLPSSHSFWERMLGAIGTALIINIVGHGLRFIGLKVLDWWRAPSAQ